VRSDLVALLDGDALRAPAPGWFHRLIAADHLIAPGDIVGELEVLGRVALVRAPRVRGLVRLPAGDADARRAVGYGDVLVHVEAGASPSAVDDGPAVTSARAASGLVFRAPSSGRFYVRPSPDKPPFVASGIELATGATVCLLEVMKTFHRVAYGGGDVPPRARVTAVLVADGADVNAGDPLLALEAI
jgi:acetyl-CoA carboxylase biotin carboxyl carrier protein